MRIYFLVLILLCLYGCQHTVDSIDESTVLNKLYERHEQWQGVPYQLGGMSQQGIDCSGFVALTFAEMFDLNLPRTTHLQSQIKGQIPLDMIQAGDLLFFKIPQQKKYYHVGIYLEAGLFLHASTLKGVMISDLKTDYWQHSFWQATRVLD
ncbi:C40 family peptidase [Marinicella litoralis]|uniref:Putative lipoprotein NlpC n=1 Tax=Marinicella litoralis TaxID=644220 RepID=A0A4V3DI15_9GAMM|nr:NlpC/P60 family protein [Marinicella litoralis]TDR20381.1 putative lipoprotein NlpC [Marinicella litoralis]